MNGEPRTARSAGAEKRKKKETAVVFLIFSICRLWHLFDWWFRPVCKLIPFRGKVNIVNNSSFVVMFISFYADAKQSALEIRTSSRLLHEIHKPSTYREMWEKLSARQVVSDDRAATTSLFIRKVKNWKPWKRRWEFLYRIYRRRL